MNPNTPYEEKLELYLDGLISDDEAADLLESIDADELERLKALQAQVDASLRNYVQVTPFDEEALAQRVMASSAGQVTDNAAATSKEDGSFGRRSLVRIAVAASLLLLASLAIRSYIGGGGIVEPVFKPQSLAAVYEDSVKRGFTPYYDCREKEERFANFFHSNRGQPMALAQMPVGSEMLGLSRLGGISPTTIAMLGKVDGNKVIVFVDKSVSSGLKKAIANTSSPELSVFVEKKNGFVFCEVTPLKSSKMIEHFLFVE